MSLCVVRGFLTKRKFISKISHNINTQRYAKTKVKTTVKEFALDHFDQFYGSVFDNWASIRLGLLCPHSYCAVVNSFSNSSDLAQFFEELGAFNIKEVYQSKLHEFQTEVQNSLTVVEDPPKKSQDINQILKNLHKEAADSQLHYETSENVFIQPTKLKDRNDIISDDYYTSFYDPNIDYDVKINKEKAYDFPPHLNIYMFPRGKFKEFPPPTLDNTEIFNYYLMDGASILPVLALDVKEKEEVGDLCSAPGGKCLAIMFSLKFGKIVCNDVSASRLSKLKTVLTSYLPKVGDWNSRILISKIDVLDWTEEDLFDKVLLDVPCTNDRLSVTKDSNNIFKQDRFHERMTLPKIQTDMLMNALKTLKVNGSLVYSTCSLSPIQNDGVVHIALSKLSTTCSKQFVVQDLTSTFYPVQDLFQFSNTSHYGKLVVPFLPLNYGPMYICKINRVA